MDVYAEEGAYRPGDWLLFGAETTVGRGWRHLCGLRIVYSTVYSVYEYLPAYCFPCLFFHPGNPFPNRGPRSFLTQPRARVN